MCRILVVGDLHFSERSAKIIPILMQEITQQTIQQQPDCVIFLGDTLDRFRVIDSVWHGMATDFMVAMSKLTQVVLLIGNHDIPNKLYFMSEEHGFRALRHITNITIVDTEATEIIVGKYKFLGVPYCPNGRFQEGVDTYRGNIKEIKAIFCHQEFRGCVMNGISSKHGDCWPVDNTYIISGHIHERHHPQVNIHYPGSPYQDKSDENPDKSISLYTFENNLYPKEERIWLNVPKKLRLKITAKEYGTLKIDPKNVYVITVSGLESQLAKYRISEKTDLITTNGGKVNFKAIDSVSQETIKKFDSIPTIKEMVSEAIKSTEYLHKIHALVYS